MSAVANLSFMTLSTAARLGFGMVAFVLMARFLGPHAFGITMFWLSVGTLLAFIPHFGFTTYLLREIGARKDAAQSLMSEVLTAKLLLSGGVVLAMAVTLPFLAVESRLPFVLLTLAMLLDGMTEFFMVAYRATGRFSSETRVATATAAVNLAVIAGAMWWWPDGLSAAIAILVSRIIAVGLALGSVSKFLTGFRPASPASGFRTIRRTWAYAVDFGMQGLFGQIDSVVLNLISGPIAVGLHQAGMKLFMAASQAAPIFANVLLPRISAATSDKALFRREARTVQATFIGFGALAGMALAVLAQPIVNVLFGQEFVDLINLLPWFGCLLYARFCASAWGIVLTASGLQTRRALAIAAQWVVVFCYLAVVDRSMGNVAWLQALLVGTTVLTATYIALSIRANGSERTMVIAAGLGSLAFVPVLMHSL